MKFRHPHDETTIIDNTEIQPELQDNNGPALLVVFTSDKGIDGEIKRQTDYSKFIKECGTPIFRKHGQSYLQACNWVENGGVLNYMRLTADDATYSNVCILADITTTSVQKADSNGAPLYKTPEGVETTESTGNTPILVNSARIALRAQSFTDLRDKSESGVVDKMQSLVADTNGTKTVPLFTCLSKGKGAYGDMYRFRLTPELIADRDTHYRNYSFELFENIGGLSRIEDPLTVSIYPNAMDLYKRSVFLDDIIKDNVYPVSVYSYQDGFDVITEILKPLVMVDGDISFLPENIDYLFGLQKSGDAYPNITMDTAGLNLSALEGVSLASGSDGAFAMSNLNRLEAINAKITAAYTGAIDPNIFNVKKFPTDMMLDSNLPMEVKRSLETCCDKRNDSPLVLDAGFQLTLSSAKAWRGSEMLADDYKKRLYFQSFSTKDKYTGKEIQVTVPYLLSIMIPQHFINVGNHKPMAGSNYPIKDIVIANSLRPSIIENEDKTDFYDMRMNYIEEDVNYLIFGTQLTSQKKTSELSNANNIDILYEMKKVIENLVPRFRYEFTESDDDMANFNRTANQALQAFQDYKCKYVNVAITQTPNQKQRKILQTKLRIGFKAFNERNDIYMIIER